MNFIDPDGRKVEFRKGVPEWVKELYYATIEYMKETGTYDLVFKELEESEKFIVYIDYIEKIDKDNDIGYNCLNSTIYWSPYAFFKNKNGTYAFPATILAHEGVHALQHKKYGDKKYKEKIKTEDPQYKNQLEREVIEDYEWEIARKHGDIKENEKTRENHKGLPYIPHKALIDLYEVCGIAEKNRENCNIMLDSLKWELILKYYSTQQSH